MKSKKQFMIIDEQVLKSAIGIIKNKESGTEYVKRMRADWKKR